MLDQRQHPCYVLIASLVLGRWSKERRRKTMKGNAKKGVLLGVLVLSFAGCALADGINFNFTTPPGPDRLPPEW